MEPPNLSISVDKACFVILKAREFHVKAAVADPDEASNATDDGMIEVLEDHAGDPIRDELKAFIDQLNEDERTELVALAWLGRSDLGLDAWSRFRGEALRSGNARTAEYLLGMPLLGDYLEEGLAIFGLSCRGFVLRRL